ncbi:hypothetical protein B0W48_16620 [Pseudoalteromonas aliena]|uniref:Histidine kinase/HSP90-like ATPase domain-containing protein n=1 Tax=Pseudoalteromonas aliena TaxID=247523 RepID=A0A1Q2H1J5_9GAMM|nr:ATP-binding protein [Pseudoalteromonas aliena]AQQ01249.1 hypothetical protein B0W48_16620 [Pseudoalteromonas aliena]
MKKLIFLLLFMLGSFKCFAFNMQHLNAATQDNNKNIYFSSHDGVYRFDGSHYLNLSTFSDLPRRWTSDVIFQSPGFLYIAYKEKDVWQFNLNTLEATKLSDITAIKLAANNTHLFMLGREQLALLDLETLEVIKPLSKKTKMFDVSASANHGYVMANDGVYVINASSTRLIDDTDVNKGELVATPYGVVYFLNDHMTSYSYLNDVKIVNDEITSARHLRFSPPYFLYYVDRGSINQAEINQLSVLQKSINPRPQAYKDLFVDDEQNLWALDVSHFEVVSSKVRLDRLTAASIYNVIATVNDKTWVGTDDGLYAYSDGKYSALNNLNQQISKLGFSVTALQQESGTVLVTTNLGAYVIDLNTEVVTQFFKGYVINLAIIDKQIYLSTNDEGVQIFSSDLSQIDSGYINKFLPHEIVWATKKLKGKLYIANEKGLISFNDRGDASIELEKYAPVADVQLLGNTLFAATYGNGLFKKVNGKWDSVVSPLYINELHSLSQELYLSTNHGIHKFSLDDAYTNLLEGTGDHSFTPNGILSISDKIVAVSNQGVIRVKRKRHEIVPNSGISYIQTNTKTYLNPETLKVNNSAWLDIALTNYIYTFNDHINYQYRLNMSEWHDIPTPLIQLNKLNPDAYTLEYRSRVDGAVWSKPQSFSFDVSGAWYSSNSAMWFYAFITIGLIICIAGFIFFWLQSFHRVFKSHQTQLQREGLSVAAINLANGIDLCNGNETRLCDGLVKLKKAHDILNPIANSHASLGHNDLATAIDMLHVKCLSRDGIDSEFNVTLGKDVLTKQLQCDIYAVLYHAVENVFKHASATKITVHLNKVGDKLILQIIDNGKGLSILTRSVNFGLGYYVINSIAKEYKQPIKRSSSRKGTKVVAQFPIILQPKPIQSRTKNAQFI